jgi:cysteine synthase
VWPSTGNYCRGGVAISKIMGCRGVAVLPEGMSIERFNWLDRWVADPTDVIKTHGSESNVKEIYDKCAELDRDSNNVIFNQFSEFGNHLVHWLCTGRALETVFEHLKKKEPGLNMAAYVSATGSAGTIAAGDHLKEKLGARIVAVEAAECPTLLYNGFGAHNIQGIGDKHIPFIHNAMNTDFVVGVSDAASDSLFVLFNTEAGRNYLKNRRGVDAATVDNLKHLGFSGIANVVAAIKVARYMKLGHNDLITTVATDSAALYGTEMDKLMKERFHGRFDEVSAGETSARYLLGAAIDHVMETTLVDRERMFNLGYFTWVEQQGVSLKDFEARRQQSFWRGLRDLVPAWDALMVDMNRKIASA